MKKILAFTMILVCAVSLFVSCSKETKKADEETAKYSFGENVTFRSEEPVTYQMSFSDASWYPMKDSWKTEGIFKKIEEMTNVKLDIVSYDSGDYNQKVNLAINSGTAAYIIPKIYTENDYVAGGGIVAVSDYVQYMPNYQAFVKKYNLEPDIDTIRQSDGKYYRLPGLHQAVPQDYTLIVREDIFEAAGFNVRELEKDWTWEDLHDILVEVKKYMVKNGMCEESDYIWSDLWCGESGHQNGGNLLKLMGWSYNVHSGWGIEGTNGGIKYDPNKDEFYCSSVSEDFKKFVTVANSFIKDRILDPETFTQTDEVAHNKFYNGKTVIMSTNRGQYSTDVASTKNMLGDSAKIYITVYPVGTTRNLSGGPRLENGVMLSRRALDELGEEGFIKMVRFVDWLFYSSEAYSLVKWGPENEIWTYQERDGQKVKTLNAGYKNNGLGISGKEEDLDVRLEWGYGGGNFFYGHSTAELSDNFTPELQDLMDRYTKYRDCPGATPTAKLTEDEREQMTLWSVPLTDNISVWTLKFVMGHKDVNKDWDEYIASCKNLNLDDVVNLTNKAYQNQK